MVEAIWNFSRRYSQDIAVDNTGHLYITGDTNGDLDGNTNSGSTNDLFVSK